MKLYIITYREDDTLDGFYREYIEDYKEAKGRLKELKQSEELNYQGAEMHKTEIPLTKKGFMEYLKANEENLILR